MGFRKKSEQKTLTVYKAM